MTGNYGKPGALGPHTSVAPLFNYSAAGREPTDPVTGGKVISGLVPCNEIADGFLSNHPERSRAMIIESGNPVHSLAESDKFRAAMRAAELTVVIDVVHTETTEQADWILPASSQYEKAEATFFGANFPANTFHLRQAILEPLEGTLTEPEIHSRLVQASGVLDGVDFEPLREAAEQGLDAFAEAFMAAAMENPAISAYGAVVLYETLGNPYLQAKKAQLFYGLVAKWLLRSTLTRFVQLVTKGMAQNSETLYSKQLLIVMTGLSLQAPI